MLNDQKNQKRTHLPGGYICVPLIIHAYLITQLIDYQPFARNTPQRGWRGTAVVYCLVGSVTRKNFLL